MNLSSFLDAYSHSIDNLPALLDDWPAIDDDLRGHYCGELEHLLCWRRSFDDARLLPLDARLRALAPRLRSAGLHLDDLLP